MTLTHSLTHLFHSIVTYVLRRFSPYRARYAGGIDWKGEGDRILDVPYIRVCIIYYMGRDRDRVDNKYYTFGPDRD